MRQCRALKLKPQERSAILAGDHPKIVRPYERGESDPPFSKGEMIVLTSQKTQGEPAPLVSITVLGHNRTKNGSWEAVYSVRDDRGLYLAKGPGYTRSRGASIDPDAAVEDEPTLKRYAAQGRLQRVQNAERREEEEKAQVRAARSKLTETLSGLQAEARTAFLAEFERMCQKTMMKDAA